MILAKLNTQHSIKRSHEEYILLAVCTLGMIGVSPFAVIRFLNAQWLMVTVDAVIVLCFLMIGMYVWTYRQVRLPGIVLSIFYLSVLVVIVHINGPSVIYWAFPTMTAAYFLLKPGEAVLANALALIVIIPVMNLSIGYLEFLSIFVTLILNNIFSFVFSRNMQIHQNVLETRATRDSLTGAGNRRLFDENVSDSLAFLKRNNEITTMVILDIDHFKNINDTYGHVMGDEVLVELSKILRERLRETDGLYRIGGEEFAILLRGADADAAINLAEELRCLVEKKVKVPGDTLTISLGVAECDVLDTNKTWQERTDSALYQAKNSGRNRTCYEQSHSHVKEVVMKNICYH